MIPILAPTPENLRQMAEALRQGELVGMPTETVYGLAGDALNPAALARIFEIKNRPVFDPLIVHIAERAWAEELCAAIPSDAEALMARFWPGPLTLVLPKKARVPDLATAGFPTVALRMPAHPAALALLRETGRPLAAPSANPFGGLSPTTAAHVAAAFSGGIAGVIDGGPCEVGVESTVLGWREDGGPVLLRAGGLAVEDLETFLGRSLTSKPLRADPNAAAESPGMLPWHYAPRTPLRLWDENPAPIASSRCGLLWFGPDAPTGFAHTENLSPRGDMREAAAELFAALHRLDAFKSDRIVARCLPESGLGRAVNDRLRKAAAAPPQA